MVIYLIRHGNPDYINDTLTDIGKVEANRLAHKFDSVTFDKIYASTHGRAHLTAEFTARRKNMEIIDAPWAREDTGANYFMSKIDDEHWTWAFWHPVFREQFRSQEVLSLGYKWYEHPYFKDTKFKEGVMLMNESVDNWLRDEFGIVHDRETHKYEVTKPLPNKIALFAHGGFAVSFLSSLLEVPYNLYTVSIGGPDCTAVATIQFDEKKETFYLYQWNDVSHLGR